jgi:hypothetical protein
MKKLTANRSENKAIFDAGIARYSTGAFLGKRGPISQSIDFQHLLCDRT